MRIDPTAWTAMAIARCLASTSRGRWTPARLAEETGAGDAMVRRVLTRLELARLVAWSPERGGYVVSRPVATISVAEVVTAAAADPAPAPTDGHAPSASAALTAAVWPSLVAALESVSLAETLPPAQVGSAPASPTHTSRAVH
jgi:DNA-binding IscR family transcriptional regulator